VHLARAAGRVRLPARFQLVAAMNPCPCGHLGDTTRECRCTPEQVQRYRARLSGPLLDRIDLRVEVAALPPAELFGLPPGEPSAAVAERVRRATEVQRLRQGLPNARLEARTLEQHCALQGADRNWLAEALARLGASARAAHRVLRVARSIADLAAAPRITRSHLAEALQLRRALGGA
jgi:magnesium chelatase family protein